ncbi:nitronate monooxygenase [bacterium]|nr:nitronate monooxygenase [bacterium]
MAQKTLTQILGISYPVIMAPMFLVSNEAMVIAAGKAGITGAIPALNWRSTELMKKGIEQIKAASDAPFGINLIVNKSNIKYKEQLHTLCELGVDYLITSLGNPKETIEAAHANGIKVFCDVTDLKYALKVQELGADAVIAVNSNAGGHAGNIPKNELIALLQQEVEIPIISAGGVGNAKELKETLALGVAGCSVGSIFIASSESPVSDEYKQACIDYGKSDIVMTTKLSGTPCTVIKTPYVEEIGTKQSFLESLLNHNKRLKKWAKMLTFYKGMKSLEKAAFSATYKTVWCAGPTIENTKAVRPIAQIVNDLVKDIAHE